MKLKLILICAMVALSLSLFSCTSKQASLEITCDKFMEYQHFTWEVKVNTGDSVIVTLCSNPTTGFQWSESAQISDQTILQQTGHRFEGPEAENIIGGAGKEIWTFKALKKGTSTISMEYSRPWEQGVEPAKTFTLTVIVKQTATKEVEADWRRNTQGG